MKRRDIQIYRGISVIAVVLFHQSASIFPMGFLGVDVFFVISGFVVTPLIIRVFTLTDSRSYKSKLLDFYKWRFFRLIPALSAMLLVSIPVIFFLGNLNDHERFGKQALATLMLLGNFGAYKYGGDYFHHYPNPLIHTWSLAVEEQFYLGLPILLLLLVKWKIEIKKKTLILISLIGAISLIIFIKPTIMNILYSLIGTSLPQDIGFYSPLSRIWEFCVGGFAYFLSVKTRGDSFQRLKCLQSIIALSIVIILISPVAINGTSSTIIVVLSTGILLVKNLSSVRMPKVQNSLHWFGDRSYSIYLVHMPIIYLFANSPLLQTHTWPPRFFRDLVSLATITILGNLLFRKVENKYRLRHSDLQLPEQPNKSLLHGIAKFIGLPTFLLIFMLISHNDNYFGIIHVSQPPYAGNEISKICVPNQTLSQYPCHIPNANANGILLLLGDSHAEQYFLALKSVAESNNLELHFWNAEVRNPILKEWIRENRPSHLILSKRWRAEDFLFENIQAIKSAQFYAHQLLIVGSNPTFPDEQRFMNQASVFTRKYNPPRKFMISDMNQKDFLAGEKLKWIASREKIRIIETWSVFCDRETCERWSEKGWYYYDDDHLSVLGAQKLIPAFNRFIKDG
jgi:peptidoglycan/LPS O-acetylase OafA/YrhL